MTACKDIKKARIDNGNFGFVSVLMSVYKTDKQRLERSVTSILTQTYNNFEFIIVDDGADDDCKEYLNSIEDSRVRIIHNNSNIGLAASLNKGIDEAKGKYIARMDADDYSFPQRIYEQVKYMSEHQEIDVLACISADIKDGRFAGDVGGAYKKFNNEEIKIELSMAPKSFPHPSVVFKASFLKENGIRYDERFYRAQDYDMWARCSTVGQMDSLQKVLVLYDVGDNGNSGPSEQQVYFSNITKINCLERLIPNASDGEKELYIHMKDLKVYGQVGENIRLIKKLILANEKKRIYNVNAFSRIIYFWWGRKMLYRENRAHLVSFIKDYGFLVRAIEAILCKMPAHLAQKRYEKKIIKTMENSLFSI